MRKMEYEEPLVLVRGFQMNDIITESDPYLEEDELG